MDDDALVRRVLSVQITVVTARRLFPGVSRSELYAAAPHDGHGRRLSLRRAFEIARLQFETEAGQARAARATETRADALAARQAAAALPTLDHLAALIAHQGETLEASLRERGAGERAVAAVSRVAAVNLRHAARVHARLQRAIQKAGAHESS